MTPKTYKYNQDFILENGSILKGIEIGYHTFGKLNHKKDNVIWVCHALTANSDVLDWWAGLFGDNKFFSPEKHFIVCANVLGSTYGTTNPISINPNTQKPYLLDFPQVTIRDMVKAHILLANHLEIENIHTTIGGSLGGQQTLEWSILEPGRSKHLILIATNAKHSPWGIAFNESQRLAITADSSFLNQEIDGGQLGLKAARSIALLSYRSHQTYNLMQQEASDETIDDFRASSYQSYQGEKLVKRFNAYSYWYLSKAMDSHNVGRNRGGTEQALSIIQSKTLVIGVSSDLLFPPDEQRYLANKIPNADYEEIESLYGHDGFLIETDTLNSIIANFYNK